MVARVSVPLTSCLTGLDWSVLQIKTNIVSCHTADSKVATTTTTVAANAAATVAATMAAT
jgi:hypothetical protein